MQHDRSRERLPGMFRSTNTVLYHPFTHPPSLPFCACLPVCHVAFLRRTQYSLPTCYTTANRGWHWQQPGTCVRRTWACKETVRPTTENPPR